MKSYSSRIRVTIMLTLIKLKIHNCGRFLSKMIMPNISIFITWGIMTSLFIPLGWQPNKELEQLISPMVFYLLPIFIGYTGGRLISGERGGLVASIATIGVITSTDIPMLLGAMIIGPLSGWIIKHFDQKIENNIKNGFEMIVNNFSIAIIGILLSIISFFAIGPCLVYVSHILGSLIKSLVQYNLLPITAIIIEPAKIFFLNNIINHAIFVPLGIQEILDNHNSIFFLMESNPAPGLGILMAWFFFGKGELSKSSGGAAIIEFFGGVHEIYFPYVLIQPKLVIALILGSMTGIFMLVTLHGGLISTASPGSMISILAMTPKGFYFSNISAIFCSFCVSFITAFMLLKFNMKSDRICNKKMINTYDKSLNLNLFKNTNNNINQSTTIFFKNIKNIIFACDAGMGSSAMGASILRKKIKNSNLEHIYVSNTSIDLLPKNADLIITHENLTHRAKKRAPFAKHISLKNFLNHTFYDSLVKNLIDNLVDVKRNNLNEIHSSDTKVILNHKSNNLFKLTQEDIFLNQKANNKIEAIKIVGNHLVKQGYVNCDYIDSMLEREKISSTWLGESIALPHGTIKSKDSVLKTGIIFCQFPKGVHFGEDINDIAYLIIGVAAKNNEHIMVVSKITSALDNKDIIKKLSKTNNTQEFLSLLEIDNN